MNLQSLGYVGISTRTLDDWSDYGKNLLGLQPVDRSGKTLAFRMDDRKQRLHVEEDGRDGCRYFGWEVADGKALDLFGAHLEAKRVRMERGSRALAEQRRVAELLVLHDPAGNRLEVFHGAEVASSPFRPGRALSGFRTGALGLGHVVINTSDLEELIPFYTDVMGFRLSDFALKPFKAYFFHINPRHHSLAFVETGLKGVHHLMLELFSLDDVGQGWDLAQGDPEIIGATLGRHTNDFMTSFYSFTPSKFMVEYGWGGRDIDPGTWEPYQMEDGPSLWGHDRTWLDDERRQLAREMRLRAAAGGAREPVQVMAGNHQLLRGTCPWWDDMTSRA
jgi:2,3-dihydroxybiphenyl 1,2-dioxygenase